jgi:hypothetical protein
MQSLEDTERSKRALKREVEQVGGGQSCCSCQIPGCALRVCQLRSSLADCSHTAAVPIVLPAGPVLSCCSC